MSILESLVDRAPSETRSIMLDLVRRHAGARRPADLLAQRDRDDHVAPSPVDLRIAHTLDGVALAAAGQFEAVLLSPVAPLGACSVLAPTSQDRTLSTTRSTEVVSDPTNALALECARRLRAQPNEPVRLCTVHQVLRAQSLPREAGFTRHFRMFALVEAGRAQPSDGFEVEAFARHLDVYERVFVAAEALGYRLPPRRAIVLSAPGHQVLAERVRAGLPAGSVETGPLDADYYDGLRVLYGLDSADRGFLPIADIGRFDWVAQLNANAKLRFVASGMGIQLLALLFAPQPTAR